MKHITRIVVLLLLVVLLFTCSCVFNPWYVSCNGQIFKHRGVWVVQSEIHEFAEKYIFSPYFTIELPEDYPSLKNIYYAMADWSKQIYTPDEMYINRITTILEFDFPENRFISLSIYWTITRIRKEPKTARIPPYSIRSLPIPWKCLLK